MNVVSSAQFSNPSRNNVDNNLMGQQDTCLSKLRLISIVKQVPNVTASNTTPLRTESRFTGTAPLNEPSCTYNIYCCFRYYLTHQHSSTYVPSSDSRNKSFHFQRSAHICRSFNLWKILILCFILDRLIIIFVTVCIGIGIQNAVNIPNGK